MLTIDRFVFMGMQVPTVSQYNTPRTDDDSEAKFSDSATLIYFQVRYITTGLPVAVKDVNNVMSLSLNTMTLNKTKKASEADFVKVSDSVEILECTRDNFKKSGIEKVFDQELASYGSNSFMCVDMSKIQVKESDAEKIITNLVAKDCDIAVCGTFFSDKKAFYKLTRISGFIANQRFDANGADQKSVGARRVFTHRIVESVSLDATSYDVRMRAQIVQQEKRGSWFMSSLVSTSTYAQLTDVTDQVSSKMPLGLNVFVPGLNVTSLMQVTIELADDKHVVQYTYFNIVALCAEIIGISIVVYSVGMFLMRPYSYHSFVARALQKLYIVQGGLGDTEPHDVKLTFGQKLCFCFRVIFRSCCRCTTDSGSVAKWL